MNLFIDRLVEELFPLTVPELLPILQIVLLGTQPHFLRMDLELCHRTPVQGHALNIEGYMVMTPYLTMVCLIYLWTQII